VHVFSEEEGRQCGLAAWLGGASVAGGSRWGGRGGVDCLKKTNQGWEVDWATWASVHRCVARRTSLLAR
jgi:hypothetical protein